HHNNVASVERRRGSDIVDARLRLSEEDCRNAVFPLPTPPRARAVVSRAVSPFSRFAPLRWTGSELSERELRRWTTHGKNMSLSGHASYDNKRWEYPKAATEEDIFAHLSLEYVPPWERNA
ncbi:DNA-directed DNA/RNA polymerase mu, partial [Phyllopteryx taeniolatus]|uniref:DNA-directed DNA/RNA polymerase mu n=1 Tax=Phyllopteryx taeniolatus TaxID=161469 RepID=UPI002AD4A939